jgi:hypothetical protein
MLRSTIALYYRYKYLVHRLCIDGAIQEKKIYNYESKVIMFIFDFGIHLFLITNIEAQI